VRNWPLATECGRREVKVGGNVVVAGNVEQRIQEPYGTESSQPRMVEAREFARVVTAPCDNTSGLSTSRKLSAPAGGEWRTLRAVEKLSAAWSTS
jgi:hypothetical protein